MQMEAEKEALLAEMPEDAIMIQGQGGSAIDTNQRPVSCKQSLKTSIFEADLSADDVLRTTCVTTEDNSFENYQSPKF